MRLMKVRDFNTSYVWVKVFTTFYLIFCFSISIHHMFELKNICINVCWWRWRISIHHMFELKGCWCFSKCKLWGISIHHMFELKFPFSWIWERWKRISIHHMFELKFNIVNYKNTFMANFNTSYVWVKGSVCASFMVSILISIHHMFELKNLWWSFYPSYCYISIHHMFELKNLWFYPFSTEALFQYIICLS